MFGKNSYQNYFNDPQFSSPPTIQYSRPNGNTSSVFDLNSSETVLHHHHNSDSFSGFAGHYLAGNNAPILETDVALNHKVEILHGYPTSIHGMRNQTVPKKDRHSKINTSQGPRDRRIRLSIGIARKFFDLQELLGFNKPSKTLDWLLRNSEAAIKELVIKSNVTSSPSECEEVLSQDNTIGPADVKGKSVASNKCRDLLNLTKESRAKARARARDRTKEKMSIKQLNEVTRSTYVHASGSRDEVGIHFPVTYYGGTDSDLIQEIKRKLQQQPIHSVYGGFSRDFVSSSSAAPSSNANENWDYGNFIAQSNQLCAIMDQHKFIN